MKYQDMTWGMMEAVINKLGGIEGAQQFLRGQTEVKAVERVFRTWRIIKLGTYENVTALFGALAQADIHISESATEILDSSSFTLASKETEIELVAAEVTELGFTGSVLYDAIRCRIRKLNHVLCPAEVGPQLRLQYYADQPPGERLVIAMEEISSNVFGVERGGLQRWLDTRSDMVFHPEDLFIFARRKSR